MNKPGITFLLLAGLPGVGKSTLARALCRDLQWHLIDKDWMKKELLDQGLENDAAGYLAYEQAFDSAFRMLAREGTSVILDSPALQKFIVPRAREIIAVIPRGRLKIVLCVADRDLRNERLRQRPPQMTTLHVDPATIADYFKIFRHLPDDTYVLDTNRLLEECIAELKAYLET